MAIYQYQTTPEQDDLLARALARANAGSLGPLAASASDLVTLTITGALDRLAAEQASAELTQLASTYAQADATGRALILQQASAVVQSKPTIIAP